MSNKKKLKHYRKKSLKKNLLNKNVRKVKIPVRDITRSNRCNRKTIQKSIAVEDTRNGGNFISKNEVENDAKMKLVGISYKKAVELVKSVEKLQKFMIKTPEEKSYVPKSSRVLQLNTKRSKNLNENDVSGNFTNNLSAKENAEGCTKIAVNTCLSKILKLSNNSEEGDKENFYIVESIENVEVRNSFPIFEVKWKDYPASKNTWEPLENLFDCDELQNFIDREKTKHKVLVDHIFNQLIEDIKKNKIQILETDTEIINMIENIDDNIFTQAYNLDLILLALLFLNNSRNRVCMNKISERLKQRLLLKPYIKKRKEQLMKIKKWKSQILRTESKLVLEVENNIDFDAPPDNFTYIIENFASVDIQVCNEPPIGCKCKDCNYFSHCCAKLSGSTFAYFSNKRIRLETGYPIFECNKRCACPPDCNNRVVQNGPNQKLCIFKTKNCGWGVKAKNPINEGEFIIEYVGEIITVEEADRRGKFYAEERTYFFDLDFNEKECAYTIDATLFGNVSRFINHSCNPNSQIYPVWVNCLDPNLPRLALFATRRIESDEEITFDYMNIHARSSENETTSALCNIDNVLCHCGAKHCRKYIF